VAGSWCRSDWNIYLLDFRESGGGSLVHFGMFIKPQMEGAALVSRGWVRDSLDDNGVPITFEFPNGSFGGGGYSDTSHAPGTFSSKSRGSS
jgi:hypothetical protein